MVRALPRQCIEPDCVKAAREDSKYCSDECGMKLARLRLLTLLPKNVEEYFKEQPQSELRTLEELRAIDQKIGQIQRQTETMLGYVRIIQRYVTAMKSTTSVNYDEPGDVDFMVNCTVCGMEINGRLLPKHVERCFVRSEKQTSFGTPTPATFNPDNLFCEAYNKANNTYCKRVRVICAEHYKGELENDLQICAYPKAWAEGKSLTFAEMFEHGPDLLKDQGFCCAPRKECAQHHRWVQALVGTIECERMNLLTRLDELLERRKIVSLGCASRGDCSWNRLAIMAKAILLFDVDGTLTPARQKIRAEIREFLMKARERIPLAVVGGSDLAKIVEQLADSKEECELYC
ncbi:hypothetical protein OESDEN_07342 [Oesophagostomum dentatum]|uniref:CXXC-type zinc finger protein 1 n=1 Tax=Oesophagostomum dentatum TaxID=61180 RepID=A0A0B1T6A1_OESDE|nr:hypothetical protein OESDEN_07342 [Oesophagostomum dentatum]